MGTSRTLALDDPNGEIASGVAKDAVLANDVVLEATLLKTGDYRVTAAGRAVLWLELEHLSSYSDLDPGLRLEVRMMVMVMGELAQKHRSLSPGCLLRVTGRLNQKRWIRDGKVRWGRMELVAIDVQVLSSSSRSG